MESDINSYFNTSSSDKSSIYPLIPSNDSAYIYCLNIFNPHSILYTNSTSEFGVTIGFLKFILHGLCITFMCIFGVIGNTLAIVV